MFRLLHKKQEQFYDPVAACIEPNEVKSVSPNNFHSCPVQPSIASSLDNLPTPPLTKVSRPQPANIMGYDRSRRRGSSESSASHDSFGYKQLSYPNSPSLSVHSGQIIMPLSPNTAKKENYGKLMPELYQNRNT
ncbi:hypothetical protein TrispH2_008611 [Trichoplax sp. H2]|nr:hypothetical protein TrispH2_008611 [Trichoplax sp. H2]|eukprot:RDD38990.1 hypothetical protein TrispH2_008611 [Trichoplax sp. H2]